MGKMELSLDAEIRKSSRTKCITSALKAGGRRRSNTEAGDKDSGGEI